MKSPSAPSPRLWCRSIAGEEVRLHEVDLSDRKMLFPQRQTWGLRTAAWSPASEVSNPEQPDLILRFSVL